MFAWQIGCHEKISLFYCMCLAVWWIWINFQFNTFGRLSHDHSTANRPNENENVHQILDYVRILRTIFHNPLPNSMLLVAQFFPFCFSHANTENENGFNGKQTLIWFIVKMNKSQVTESESVSRARAYEMRRFCSLAKENYILQHTHTHSPCLEYTIQSALSNVPKRIRIHIWTHDTNEILYCQQSIRYTTVCDKGSAVAIISCKDFNLKYQHMHCTRDGTNNTAQNNSDAIIPRKIFNFNPILLRSKPNSLGGKIHVPLHSICVFCVSYRTLSHFVLTLQ